MISSFYASLAKAASVKKKSLREYIQLIERLHIISSIYTLEVRDYFVIFYYLLNDQSDKKTKKELPTTNFTGRSGTIYRVNTRDGILLEIYNCIIESSFNHAFIELSGGNIHNSQDIITYNTVKNFVNENFSGAKLAESVKQKLNFLDTFHFGTQPSVNLIPGTFEEVGHE